jgi:hypothetical protein
MTQTALTREQVLNAEPGIELDILVAEHVFGWRRISGPEYDYDGPVEHGEVLIPPNMSEAHAYAMMPPRGIVELSYFVNRHWSKDISAAWDVINGMHQKSWWVVLSREDELWHAMFFWDPHQTAIEVDSELAPEAICKAALLAVLDL